MKLILLMLLLTSLTSFGKSMSVLEINSKRVINIQGPISGSIVKTADNLLKLSEGKDKSPVYLIINSPGGSVLAGLQFINAMNIVQSRGIRIKCLVTTQAASMAFQIFSECQDRYSFKHSLHLWHPLRVPNASNITPEISESIYKDLLKWEDTLVESLKNKLDISDELFYYHYKNETFHSSLHLKKMSPRFLNIINDVKGVKLRLDGASL